MTVSRHKRRMSTARALGLSIASLVLAAVLGVVGVIAISNTKDGEAQGSNAPVDRFPDTPTGMVAVVDGTGRLGSVAVFAVRPADDEGAARGGNVVVLPVSADVSGGYGDERAPLAELVRTYGTDGLADDVAALLGVTIDAPVIVTVDELAAWLEPLGSLSVDVPDQVVDADGEVVVEAGEQTIDPATAAAILGAGEGSAPATSTYPIDVAVWRAVAAAVGDGADDLPAPGSAPATSAAALRNLTSGPVDVTTVGARSLSDLAVNPDGVDAVALDRAEVLTLFGHVAPSRVAAPNPGYTVLVRSHYADDQLGSLSRYDVAYAAVSSLLGVEANVLSVDTSAGSADEATVVEVTDSSMIAGAERLADVFGEVDVRVGDRRVAGVNLVVTLGTDFLPLVEASARPAGTGAAASTPETGSEATAPTSDTGTAASTATSTATSEETT